MKSQRGGLLFLAGGGMELCWLYAWTTFVVTSILHRPFPLPEAIGTFALAAVLTLVVRGRGWRVILILGLQVFGFLLATSRIVHVFFYEYHPFFGQWWLLESFRQPKDPMEWLILVIILFFALLFWAGGATLARRPAAYLTVCARFDLGVAAFFFLLLIKFLLLVKGGIDIKDSTPELLLFPFFVFSLLAIGMARNRSSAQKDFLSGYQGVGVILSFSAVALAFGAGLVLLFLPYLSAAAEMGYGVLRSAAGPLSPILISIIRFLLIDRRRRLETVSSSSGSDEAEIVSSTESSGWMALFEKLSWGLLGLGVLIALILCGLGMWYLFRWLFSRTTGSEKRQIQWSLISSWGAQLWSVLLLCWEKIVREVKGHRSAVQLYSTLLNWGRHSGLHHFLSETPTEYGERLGHQFPTLNREIGLIAEAFNKEVYGDIVLDEQQFTLANLAWRRLRSPIHWPSRFKSWFLQP